MRQVKDYQQNYLEYFLSISTNQIPWTVSDHHPKGIREKDQSPKRQKVGVGQMT
jgi:hypothetical protein